MPCVGNEGSEVRAKHCVNIFYNVKIDENAVCVCVCSHKYGIERTRMHFYPTSEDILSTLLLNSRLKASV